MLGIIGALSAEIYGLVVKLDGMKESSMGNISFYSGKLYEKEVVIALSGIGKVNASMTAALMLARFPNIKGIINIGVAGGTGLNVRQGDIVIADKCVQHDMNLNPTEITQEVNKELIEFYCDETYVHTCEAAVKNKPYPYHIGTVATGDEFVSSKAKADYLRERFGAIACDMESCAIAQICYKMNVRFLSCRSISDNGDESADKDFSQWLEESAGRSIDLICDFVRLVK